MMREVSKLEPHFSPEVVVQVLDKDNKPIRNVAVWLTPTDQPTNAVGGVTDDEGKAWFVCKAGPGTYTAWVRHEDRWYNAALTPAPVGEWMQVKRIQVIGSQ
ncbi:MAG: Ig-like domain-containing protein [Phycisphaerae bacterium]|nr:Ig-like domain-containing protein [Phycisphaerae bacterium]